MSEYEGYGSGSAGGDDTSSQDPAQDPNQPDPQESQGAPTEEQTSQGGIGTTTGDGEEQGSEREAIIGEQGVGDESAGDQSAAQTGSFDPNAPRATSAPPAAAQSGVPNLPENEGVEPDGDDPDDDE